MTNTSKSPHRLKTYFGIAFLISILPLFLISVPKTGVNIPNIDKVIHMAFHFIVASWFLLARERVVTTAVIAGGYGIIVEVLQSFTPYRSFEWLDVMANLVGLVVATFGYKLIFPVKTCTTGPDSQQLSTEKRADKTPPGA